MVVAGSVWYPVTLLVAILPRCGLFARHTSRATPRVKSAPQRSVCNGTRCTNSTQEKATSTTLL